MMPLSKEEYIQFFREADADNSGELTLDELLNLLRKKGFKGSDSDLKKYFISVDTSGDGKLNLEEYLVAMGQIPQQHSQEASLRQLFRSFDNDGNGVIDKKELQAVFKESRRFLTDQEAERMMKLLDADGDGSCDYEEFMEYFYGRKK